MSQIDQFDSLVEAFSSSARLIRKYLISKSVSGYVNEAHNYGTTEFPLSSAPEDVKDANKSLWEAMAKLQQMFTDPVKLWSQTAINLQYLSCLSWIVHFNIPAHIPLDKPVSYTTVAEAAKVPEHQLRHIARMAMTGGLFNESSANMLGHTPLSAHFATSPLHLETALFQTQMATPIAMKMTDMTCKYNGSDKTTETAHNIAMATDLPFFPYLSKNPAIAAQLEAGMKFLGGTDETHILHLLGMFNWEVLGEAEVVDVGGSTGHASIALAQAFPKLTFTVQDLPSVIRRATSQLLPELKDRVRFVPHDFFLPQPPASSLASVFLLRMIVQNHPKRAAQTILRNIASVMKPGALILLNNIILPDPGSVGLRTEALDRAKSLFMMQAMNGAERGEDEFRELVEETGAGLRVREVMKREGSGFGLITVEKL